MNIMSIIQHIDNLSVPNLILKLYAFPSFCCSCFPLNGQKRQLHAMFNQNKINCSHTLYKF